MIGKDLEKICVVNMTDRFCGLWFWAEGVWMQLFLDPPVHSSGMFCSGVPGIFNNASWHSLNMCPLYMDFKKEL